MQPTSFNDMLVALGPWESIDAAHESLNEQWKQSLDGVGVLHRGSSMTTSVTELGSLGVRD